MPIPMPAKPLPMITTSVRDAERRAQACAYDASRRDGPASCVEPAVGGWLESDDEIRVRGAVRRLARVRRAGGAGGAARLGRGLHLGGALRRRCLGLAGRGRDGDRADPARHPAHPGAADQAVGSRHPGRHRRPAEQRPGRAGCRARRAARGLDGVRGRRGPQGPRREARRGLGGLRRVCLAGSRSSSPASTTAPSPTRSCCPTRRCSSRILRSGWSAPRSSAATEQPSLARAARWQGLLPVWADPDNPNDGNSGVTSPERMAAIVDDVRRLREEQGLPWEGYDVVLEADSTGEFVKTELHPPDVWAEVGVTWWVESWWGLPCGRRGRARAAAPDRGRPGRVDRPMTADVKALAFDLDDTLAPSKAAISSRDRRDAVGPAHRLRRLRHLRRHLLPVRQPAHRAPRRACRLVAAAPDAHERRGHYVWSRRRVDAGVRRGAVADEQTSQVSGRAGAMRPRPRPLGGRQSGASGSRTGDRRSPSPPWASRRRWSASGRGIPTASRRRSCATPCSRLFPELEVRSGGSTSVDVTRAGIDKAYGIGRFLEHARHRPPSSSCSSATGSTRAATTTR